MTWVYILILHLDFKCFTKVPQYNMNIFAVSHNGPLGDLVYMVIFNIQKGSEYRMKKRIKFWVCSTKELLWLGKHSVLQVVVVVGKCLKNCMKLKRSRMYLFLSNSKHFMGKGVGQNMAPCHCHGNHSLGNITNRISPSSRLHHCHGTMTVIWKENDKKYPFFWLCCCPGGQ